MHKKIPTFLYTAIKWMLYSIFFISLNADNKTIDYQQLFELATKQFMQGNFDNALANYTMALHLNPTCAQAHYNMGLIYEQQKKFVQAAQAYEQALTIDKKYIKALLHAGIVAQEQNDLSKAVFYYNQVIAIDANHHEAIAYLARVYSLQSQFEQAVVYFNKAKTLNPHDPNILLELANMLNITNNTQKALDIYYQLLSKLPDNNAILYNIAYTLKKLGRINQALPFYEKVLAQDPFYAEAHFSLSLAYLAMGNFDKGWQEYEWRWKRDKNYHPISSKPLWDGTPLKGKKIVLIAEQGLGDTFQFIRYAKIAYENGGYVIAMVQPALITLLAQCPFINRVMSLFDAIPDHDVYAPLMSLPLICKTTLETIPTPIPYLYADTTLTNLWREKLSGTNTVKVGICWQGNSNYSTHFLRATVAAKSIKLSQLSSFFTMNNVTFYNLQQVTGLDQLSELPPMNNVHTFDNNFDVKNGRFMDTAAVLKNIDLMITIDTSMAHLAAGLGVPVWVLLPEPADWRWMLKRTDTPWYPNMRLFRQTNAGDWNTVIKNVHDALQDFVRTKKNVSQAATVEKTSIQRLKEYILDKEKNDMRDDAYKHALVALYKEYQKKGVDL